MRCREARQRISGSGRALFGPDGDRELLEHLRQCYECARLAHAEFVLGRDLEDAKRDDIADMISFAALKDRVEAEVDNRVSGKNREGSLMNKIMKPLKKRPSLGISIAAAVVLLLIFTLVPFRFERTLGDLAMDSDKVQRLFDILGLEDAKMVIGDCESTCRIKISDLKTEDDIKVVVAAFDELGNCTLEEINEVNGECSAPLVKQLKGDKAVITSVRLTSLGGENIRMEEAEGKVKIYVSEKLETLDSITDGAFSIWIAKDTANPVYIEETGERVAPTRIVLSTCLEAGKDDEENLATDLVLAGKNDLVTYTYLNGYRVETGRESSNPSLRVVQSVKGKSQFVLITPDGEEHRVDMNDEDVIEKLRSLGVVVVQAEIPAEKGHDAYFIGKPLETNDAEDAENISADKQTTLPDDYRLEQNYPNPFNLATTIIYSLPRAEHVKIEIFNINGQKIRTLVNEVITAGDQSVIWDAKDDDGVTVASGIYLYKLTAGDRSLSKKMTLTK